MVVPDDLFGVIPLWVAVYVIGLATGAAVFHALRRRVIVPILLGRDDQRFDQPLRRFAGMLTVAFGQRRVLQSVSLKWRDLAGLGHFAIFWGFLLFAVSYVLYIGIDSIDPDISRFILSPTGTKVFFWTLDIAAATLLFVFQMF